MFVFFIFTKKIKVSQDDIVCVKVSDLVNIKKFTADGKKSWNVPLRSWRIRNKLQLVTTKLFISCLFVCLFVLGSVKKGPASFRFSCLHFGLWRIESETEPEPKTLLPVLRSDQSVSGSGPGQEQGPWGTTSVLRSSWSGTGVLSRTEPWRTNCINTSRAGRGPEGGTAAWRRRRRAREPRSSSAARTVSAGSDQNQNHRVKSDPCSWPKPKFPQLLVLLSVPTQNCQLLFWNLF